VEYGDTTATNALKEVGAALGALVGLTEGWRVGTTVGAEVGAVVGALGKAKGESASSYPSHHTSGAPIALHVASSRTWWARGRAPWRAFANHPRRYPGDACMAGNTRPTRITLWWTVTTPMDVITK
jgi:hypothetical protein